MTIENLRKTLINELQIIEYMPDFIEKIADDVHMLMWIEYCINNPEFEAQCVNDLLQDPGFVEGMEMQFWTPITFEKMKGEE